jgi:type IV pilus assembly protein PilC
VVGLGVALSAIKKNPKGRVAVDAILLRLPVLGNVLRKVIVARFTRTLGTLLSSGVPILDSMDICAKTSGNKVVERALMYCRAKISEGKRYGDAARGDQDLSCHGLPDDWRR